MFFQDSVSFIDGFQCTNSKPNFQRKHSCKCLITHCHSEINVNISQGTSVCTPRQAALHPISLQRHSEKTVSEQVCLNRLNNCLLFHRQPGLLPGDNLSKSSLHIGSLTPLRGAAPIKCRLDREILF